MLDLEKGPVEKKLRDIKVEEEVFDRMGKKDE